MSRRRTIWLAVLVLLVLLGGAFLWALPELIRRQAVTRIPSITGRATSIGDIDLNLFTGRLVIKNFRLAERDPRQTFMEFERLEARWSWPSLLGAHIRLKDVRLVAPTVQLARTGPTEFNFSDLLGLIPPADPKAKPSRWKFTMERLGLVLGNIVLRDDAVSPPAKWRVQGLTIEAGDLTTRAGERAGHLAIQSKVGDSPFELSSNEIRLAPGAVSLGLSIKDFDLTQILPYVPPTAPAGPYAGRFSFNIRISFERGNEGVTRAVVTGDAGLDALQLIRRDGPAPFMTVPRLRVKIKEADLLSRLIVISAVEIDGLQAQALRDKNGVIDLVQAFTGQPAPPAKPGARPPAAPPPAPAKPAATSPVVEAQPGPAFKFLLERLALTNGTASFVDEAVSPRTTLTLADLSLTLESLAWPTVGPARVTVGMKLPGGGRLDITNGSLIPQPFDFTWTMKMRDAPIEPYQAYIPVPGRFSGRYNGDSKNRVALKDGKTILTSTGTSWAEKFEVRWPDAQRPALSLERMDLVGIDLDWPKRAAVAKAGFRKLAAEIERGKDGTLDISKLFGGPAQPAAGAAAAPPPPATTPPPAAGAPKPKGLLETMSLQIGEVRLEDGSVRFIDRTTEPAFSEDLSKMDLLVTGLGNKPDQRAKLVFTSVVGGEGALDIRGDIGAVGAPLYLDLVGEIRDVKLPVVNPYSDQMTAWLIQRGNLKYKFNLKVENDQVVAMNEVLVEKLRVAKSERPDDEAKKRLGLPLGLIVALIKDGNGNIVVNVPVTGSLKDPRFDWSETIWSAVRNVLKNVLASPFRLIGNLFSSEEKMEEPKVNPVTFAAGSAVLAPAAAQQLLRVADFMRQTPYVALTLNPVVAPADLDTLKAEAVGVKIQQFAKERGISEQVMAIRGYFAVRLPSEKLPPTPDDQLKLLRDREPVPEPKVKELVEARIAATKDRMVKTEGIQEKRLPVGETKRATTGEGRVEFAIGEHEAD